jgi:hypothetical protein
VFNVEVDCFCLIGTGLGAKGCTWQVLLIRLHLMWGFQKYAFVIKIKLFTWETWLQTSWQHITVHYTGKKINQIRVKHFQRSYSFQHIFRSITAPSPHELW